MAGVKIGNHSRARIVRKLKDGYLAKQKKAMMPPGQFQQGQFIPGGVYPGYFPYPGQMPNPDDDRSRIKENHLKGIKISENMPLEGFNIVKMHEASKAVRGINMNYPLIPRFPRQGQRVYAYADIRWDDNYGEIIYYVIEPEISKYDLEVIAKTKKILEEKLDINFFKLGEVKAKDMLREEAEKILQLNPNITSEARENIWYYLERDIVGMGKLQSLMQDPNIEDISCDGINIPLFVYHRDPKLGSLKTNIFFETEDELNSFVIKMAQRSKKSISIAEPLLDASLPDGSRIQATLGTDIARKGSNFTIRRFAEDPLTPTHMIKYNTMNSTQLAYLWLAVENGQSILISGGTATGKTSMLNALSLFIRPSLKVVSIEDTPELRLPHPHWIPEVARTPLDVVGTSGEVSLFDLLKSSLRQRPDYIVMGEVRGKEAFVLFQQMATGHSSLATIHAASINQLVDRLTTPPISLPPALIENVNIIVFLTLSRLEGKYVRRSDKILEITGISRNRPMTNKIFTWIPRDDNFIIEDDSVVLRTIADRQALTDVELKSELVRRKKILDWMYTKAMFDYRDVARLISAYYTNPERVMGLIEEG